MENDYKKYTLYDVLMTVLLAIGLYFYSYYGKLSILLITCMFILIIAYLQRKLIKSLGVDPTKLMKASTYLPFLFIFAFLTSLARSRTWAVIPAVIVYAVMLYLSNKSFKEKIL